MDEARQWALESLRTDAQFLFTPPQIALACIYHFEKGLVREFLMIKFPVGSTLSQGKPEEGGSRLGAAETLIRVVEDCDELVSTRLNTIQARSKEDSISLVTEIDKKLYRCRKALDSTTSNGEISDTAKRKADSSEERETKKPRPD